MVVIFDNLFHNVRRKVNNKMVENNNNKQLRGKFVLNATRV